MAVDGPKAYLGRIHPDTEAPDKAVMAERVGFVEAKNKLKVFFEKRINGGEFDEFILTQQVDFRTLSKEKITRSYCETYIKSGKISLKYQGLFSPHVGFGIEVYQTDSSIGAMGAFLEALLETERVKKVLSI